MGSIYKKILKDGSKRYEARTRLNGKPAGKRFRRRKGRRRNGWPDTRLTC